MWGEIAQSAGAAERLSELLQIQSKIKSPAHPVKLPEPPRGEIAFRNVTFAYPLRPETKALEHVSFEVKPGERSRHRRSVGRRQDHDLRAAASFLRSRLQAASQSTA